MLRVRQRFPESPPLDPRAVLAGEFARQGWLGSVAPGRRVAVAVGSRGITNLRGIVAAVLEPLWAAGAQPFIVPAMGSHGGATPKGQLGILADYGITEANLGVPIRPSMAVRQVGATPEGIPVYSSREALEADGILLVNRVKPHTDFGGDLGSGLLKMSVVGLGKREGAVAFHAAAARLGHATALRSMAAVTLAQVPIWGGVAIVEGFRHETVRLALVRGSEIAGREPELLTSSSASLARLPFQDIDVLIVDRMGKDISGTGMDSNVTGRYVHGYHSSLGPGTGPGPTVRRLIVRNLTPATRGNAIGIGLADFTTSRLVRAMDAEATYTNALTALSVQAAKVPIHFETDRAVVERALRSLGLADVAQAKVIRIRDTLSLAELEVSESYAAALRERSDLEPLSAPAEMAFDVDGNLPS
jgi:hypothetical protein